jgi:hypothetical protein
LEFIAAGQAEEGSAVTGVQHSLLWYNPRWIGALGGGEGSRRLMASYIHAIAAADLQWALYTVSLFVSVLPEEFLLIQRRGFGGRGFGFGRRRGSFGLFRILFALLFTTLLGPIVLVALIAFVAYRFFNSQRRR